MARLLILFTLLTRIDIYRITSNGFLIDGVWAAERFESNSVSNTEIEAKERMATWNERMPGSSIEEMDLLA